MVGINATAQEVQYLKPERISEKKWATADKERNLNQLYTLQNSILSVFLGYGGGYQHQFKASILKGKKQNVFTVLIEDESKNDRMEGLRYTTVNLDLKKYAKVGTKFKIMKLDEAGASATMLGKSTVGFSATGNLLPGSMQQLDTATFITLEQQPDSDSIHIWSSTCMLNTLGYIPVVSTITGSGRAVIAVVHTVVHLVCSIFSKNRNYHLKEAKLGAKHIIRGVIEATPVIGNIIVIMLDRVRINKFEKMAEKQINKNRDAYNNHIIMFIHGKEIAKCSIDEYKSGLQKLKNQPSAADIERIIRCEA